ncbi:MAG: UvrB/UvrC motif-containing protein [Oscillospiraceae bacterium]|nr:UvrB/UvrC motif-containing protein [Oscillospiraceae bacterium]
MKCENCGKHEANYHYTSNINGAVTEKHLCSECAGKLGLETDIFAGGGDMFESMIAGMFGRSRRLFDAFSPFSGMSFSMPTMLLPRIEIKLENNGKEAESAADPELKKAREINALRAQMSAAAEKEDFEKAAEIRDRIRELESAEESGKASE